MKATLILLLVFSALVFGSLLLEYGNGLEKEVRVAIQTAPSVVRLATSTTPLKEEAPSSTPPIKTPTSSEPKPSTTTTSWFRELQNLLQKNQVLVKSTTTVVVSSTTPVTPTLPPSRAVDPQTIVGILCTYDYSFAHPITGQMMYGETMSKGSGVIIDPRGYVITNRHLLEIADGDENVTINDKTYVVTIRYSLDNCKAGRVPKGTVLPTRDQIVTINPLTQVSVLAYKVEPIFIRNRFGMSSNESFFADFALMKITGVSQEGPTFGINALPSSFEYAPILTTKNNNLIDQEVITYGFPGDVTLGQGSSFETLYFTGSVGRVKKIHQGDYYYQNTPLYIETKMEIYPGRSGSPVFWRGYVIGLVMAEEADNRTNSYSVASDIILRDIQGYLN